MRGDTETKEIEYAYKCREAEVAGAKEVYAVIPPVDTKVSLTAEGKNFTGYVKEGYAFSPMLTLGYTQLLKIRRYLQHSQGRKGKLNYRCPLAL